MPLKGRMSGLGYCRRFLFVPAEGVEDSNCYRRWYLSWASDVGKPVR